ncbi:MAG: efflux transporter outer membrane subunit [Chthoniobacterales bacterium]
MAMALTLLGSGLLVGCEIAEPYIAPVFVFGAGYDAQRTGAPVLFDNAAWWRGLDDPTLMLLVDLALRDSIDLEIARERVISARESRDTVPGAAILSPSARTGVSGTNTGDVTTLGIVDVGLSWLLDPYGLRREQLRVADARIDIADAEMDGARLLVVLNISNAYVQLRYDQRVLGLAQTELHSRQDTLDLTRTLARAESATRLEIARSEARVAEIRSRLPEREAAIEADLAEIAVLAGLAPGALPADLAAALLQDSGQPLPSMSPDVGIPADLLRNRPDIRVAERSYYVAVSEIGIARAELYPRLSLSGTITLSAIGDNASGTEYFFGPVVEFPALPLDGTRAAINVQQSEARQAHATWRSTVLSSILEVETALLRYDGTALSLRSAGEAVRLYREALDLTRAVFERDEATLGDLIDAEQAVATAQQTLADLKLQYALRFIALNVSLGAGTPTPAAQ